MAAELNALTNVLITKHDSDEKFGFDTRLQTHRPHFMALRFQLRQTVDAAGKNLDAMMALDFGWCPSQ